MPLAEYEFSRRYGWIQDRYGVAWQLILTEPAGDPRPSIMPAFRYPEPTGPATAASLMFSDFTLDESWFVALDSAGEQDKTFTEAISLLVACEDQTEIDDYWESLSAVPEAEQCAWCKDRLGSPGRSSHSR